MVLVSIGIGSFALKGSLQKTPNLLLQEKELQAKKRELLFPHKPLAAFRWCRSVGRLVEREGVSGAREDLIQDSCVKGFGRNAFIRDIALPLSSPPFLSSSHCSCVRTPFTKVTRIRRWRISLLRPFAVFSSPLRSFTKRPRHKPCSLYSWPVY